MSEPYLTLPQIAATIPGARGAKQVSGATLTRWILVGCKRRDTGEVVKLAATRAGWRWLVKQSDLDAFFAALAGEIDTPPAEETPTAAERRKAIARANRNLEAAGA